MISKERLKELIKQRATVYTWSGYNIPGTPFKKQVYEIKLRKGDEIIDYPFGPSLDSYDHPIAALYTGVPLQLLYETKFEMEFQGLKRVERLDLPTWEDFCVLDNSMPNFRVSFMSKYKENYGLCLFNNLDGSKNIILYNFDDTGDSCVFDKPANEENYIEACRLVKKLFEIEDEGEEEE